MAKQKEGFSLLELAVVTIIIGILATLGFVQYSASMERSRTAEARAILGVLRSLQLNCFLENGTYATLPNLMPNIPEGTNGTCTNAAYYFQYSCNDSTGPNPGRCTADRCTTDGKPPNASTTYEIRLDPNGAWGGEL